MRADGVSEGRRDAIEAVCEVLGISLGLVERTRLDEMDEVELAVLLEWIKTERRWP